MKKTLVLFLAVALTALCGCNSAKKTTGAALKTASAQNLTTPAAAKYAVKTSTYKFKKGKKYYTAEYPQLTQNGKDFGKVNSLLKQTSLQTINVLGTRNTAQFARVQVSSHMAFSSSNFLSVTFQETVKKSENAAEQRTFRTVNYDLKSDRAVGVNDLIQKNDAFEKALKNAVKGQMSAKRAASYPDSTIKAGINSCSVFFRGNTVAFSIPVSEKLGGHVELLVNYSDTSGFRTNNAAWGYFLKK